MDLTRKFRDELGSIHGGTLQAHASMGHVTRLHDNGENLAVFVTKKELVCEPRVFPIIAAAVPTDMQRLHLGLQLLHSLDDRFKLDRHRVYQAICRCDLASNRFWGAAGFQPVAVRHSISLRAKPCIIWRRRVDRSVVGVDEIRTPARARMSGGRFLPNNRPDLANVIDQTPEGIAYYLAMSGARPTTSRWTQADDLLRTPQARPIIERPPRPDDPQGQLFPAVPRSPHPLPR